VSQAQPADVEQAPQARQVQPWAAKKPGDFTDAFGPELQPQGRYSELKAKPNPLAVIEGWRGIDLHPAEPPPTASPIPALSGVDGPGEYARIVQARQAPVKASSAPAKPPPSARERSYVPLMVVIGCLMAVALLVVLFLVLQTT
jgi:hypothetical protein